MLIGYTRITKTDDDQVLNHQIDALVHAGVEKTRIFSDKASAGSDPRPALDGCLKALRAGDTLVVWKLDRIGRNLRHLIGTVHSLDERKVDFRVIEGSVAMDTTIPSGRIVYAVFDALLEFERDRISERTRTGLQAARRRGRKGGRKFALTPEKIRAAQSALADPHADIKGLCAKLGISKATLYRYMDSEGKLREAGHKVIRSERRIPEGDADKGGSNDG